MVRNKLLSLAVFLLLHSAYAMQENGKKAKEPHEQEVQFAEEQIANAGYLAPLVNPTDPIRPIVRFLELSDIARLRRTCKALKSLWDYNQPLAFGYTEIKKVSGTTLIEKLIKFIDILKGCKNPLELRFCWFELKELPLSMGDLKNVIRLNIAKNSFNKASIKILCMLLPNLQELNLAENELTELPEEISNLRKLKELTIHGNRITKSSVSTLCNYVPWLQELDLSYNRLPELPDQMSALKELKILRLIQTHISDESILTVCRSLPNLETLDISCNAFLPATITNMRLLLLHANIIVDDQ